MSSCSSSPRTGVRRPTSGVFATHAHRVYYDLLRVGYYDSVYLHRVALGGCLDGQGFAPFGEVVEGMDVVDAFYDGYGDGPPRGEGPYPAQAAAEGNAYFERDFPELDQILEARVSEP